MSDDTENRTGNKVRSLSSAPAPEPRLFRTYHSQPGEGYSRNTPATARGAPHNPAREVALTALAAPTMPRAWESRHDSAAPGRAGRLQR